MSAFTRWLCAALAPWLAAGAGQVLEMADCCRDLHSRRPALRHRLARCSTPYSIGNSCFCFERVAGRQPAPSTRARAWTDAPSTCSIDHWCCTAPSNSSSARCSTTAAAGRTAARTTPATGSTRTDCRRHCPVRPSASILSHSRPVCTGSQHSCNFGSFGALVWRIGCPSAIAAAAIA